MVEGHVSKQSPSRIEELVKIFIHATKVRLYAFSKLKRLTQVSRWSVDFGIWEWVPKIIRLKSTKVSSTCTATQKQSGNRNANHNLFNFIDLLYLATHILEVTIKPRGCCVDTFLLFQHIKQGGFRSPMREEGSKKAACWRHCHTHSVARTHTASMTACETDLHFKMSLSL